MRAMWVRISNGLLSLLAGAAAFVFTLLGFLLLGTVNQQVVASLFIGLFALLVVRIAAERPNSGHARAVAALMDRLLAVRRGDLSSPAPAVLRSEMPALAGAVDGLFEQVRSNLENFQTMAMYDPVTALPNRIHFRREAERLLMAREPEDRTALLFIDLDGFKEVNDRLGHAMGDQVLTMVANRLRVVLKAESGTAMNCQPLLARLAGDEFTLLLPGIGSREEAERIACRALAAVAEPFRIGGHTSQMGASIGVSLCPDHGTDLAVLMKASDTAMYHAKASGRSRVCIFDAELARASEERAALHAEVLRAADEGELELVYQPRLCLRSGAILAGEAAVRWNRGSAAPVLLHDFAGLGEEAALGHRIADWTLEAACAAFRRWHGAGLPQRLCFRLPAAQLERSDFAGRLTGLLGGCADVPWLIELELDSAAVATCKAHVRGELEALRGKGVTIAVGGFGAGQSNLAAMADFPLDRVKLAPALTARIDRSERARVIVASVVHLVHGIGCEAVAAAVHREEQLEVLRAVGCDSVEGFFHADPLPENAFVSWVAAQDCARSLARAS
jgi:diguanylate cyclase (GGDEF)-like protein